ncbi:MAG: regulatory protein RecX [Nitrospirae bacterium]|uniref:regulatory protein RecX n=1 Tax=Candidatus Magnetobacterium casense TaxID=1455061 RepID=UPI00058DE269|nr:regulatory protein RecX [Candidatus Magnetobacterium casensis]MBF0336602.1 regulatory protein RecX [Nitrospirota bacterium]
MKTPGGSAANDIRKYCYRLLNRRDYTRVELYRKLIERGYPAQDIEAELLRLTDLGLLDDRRASNVLLDYYEDSKNLGAFACKEELRARGIDRAIIDELVFTEQRELEKALKVISKKTRHLKKFPFYVKLKKMHDLLSRKGFDNDTITQAIKQYKEDEEQGQD